MQPIVLVGSELEENLSLRYLAAMVEEHGFRAELVVWYDGSNTESVAKRIAELSPLVVGLSVPFQQHAVPILELSYALRSAGCGAHVCIGGHFATFEYENVLRDYAAIDSVIRHEGEIPFATLCERLRDGEDIAEIPGLATRAGERIVTGEKQPLPPLDTLPFPDRRGIPHEVMGIPTSPIVGSRGCYGDCAFCCIYAYADNADGARYRRRSPADIVAEMKQEYESRGVHLFVFHDDNFFVPSKKQNIDRYEEMKRLLEAEGMVDIGLVIKCRPNDVNIGLFELLKSMGLIRAYVGIESNSEEGIVSLNRRITSEDNERALQVLSDLEIYHSFNILIFDPEATIDGIEKNLEFLERHADVPFNFCRAEVYAGTPLKSSLQEQGRLGGDYFAWSYRMRDPRIELLFRIVTTAFHTRNFKHDGAANLNMGLRFDGAVARFFSPDCWDPVIEELLARFSRAMGENSVSLFREAIAFVRETGLHDGEAIKEFTTDLARRVARHDLDFLRQCKTMRKELEGVFQPHTPTVPAGSL